MERDQLNRWTWRDALRFSQAWRLDEPRTLILMAGQSAVAADGTLVAEGDFETQVPEIFENLRTVFDQSGARLDAIHKIVVYLTDIGNLPTCQRIVHEVAPDPKPGVTALQVSALAAHGMIVGVDATAVR